jgi:hypothetical protein
LRFVSVLDLYSLFLVVLALLTFVAIGHCSEKMRFDGDIVLRILPQTEEELGILKLFQRTAHYHGVSGYS